MNVLIAAIVRFKLEFILFFFYFISYIILLNLVDNTIVAIKKIELNRELEVDTDKTLLLKYNEKLVRLHTISNILKLTSILIAAVLVGYGILSIVKEDMSSILGFGSLCLSVFFAMFVKLHENIQISIINFVRYKKHNSLKSGDIKLKKLK